MTTNAYVDTASQATKHSKVTRVSGPTIKLDYHTSEAWIDNKEPKYMEISKSILSSKKNYQPPQSCSNNEKIATMSGFSFASRSALNRAIEKPILARREKLAK